MALVGCKSAQLHRRLLLGRAFIDGASVSQQRHVHLSGSDQARCHYKTLGVSRTATPAQVKAAYYKNSKKYHPDLNKSRDAQRLFTEINSAYEVLGNPIKKKEYDKTLAYQSTFPGQSQQASPRNHQTAGGATFHGPSNRGRRTRGPTPIYRSGKDISYEEYRRIWHQVKFGGEEYDRMREGHHTNDTKYKRGQNMEQDPFQKRAEEQRKTGVVVRVLVFITFLILIFQIHIVTKHKRRIIRHDEKHMIRRRREKTKEVEPVIHI
ncbi:dnaJ homolog subfamily B member 9 isoform X2 [Lingula anatina]|uniref:DnaJ homolog subfamily B member 9 isoform X2 n=1 Tax=Lingula anatina TaxID=7574 RepID=A0A1S3IAW0_LINAN|nr:dnaJ homolog subfamily B member 9 isoform X2 [Lingula anatina]XP_013395400.1 dnaJ homolog subfamily B member 9 isoform X2 [Lingula anatina]XP_013395401.1 dnaJ homolog subfamily B member 9 isoform X2 [Lingula anatina]|eukprot:XP_013395398.1 dnaJ homolog subfamily B member 9 isoform X2 [Lingula anatina]